MKFYERLTACLCTAAATFRILVGLAPTEATLMAA
jgi:hypothetical protein